MNRDAGHVASRSPTAAFAKWGDCHELAYYKACIWCGQLPGGHSGQVKTAVLLFPCAQGRPPLAAGTTRCKLTAKTVGQRVAQAVLADLLPCRYFLASAASPP
ncbi:MAG: hypothetical protein IPG64_15450 [Haliea sp.]|nr:hypothetical protein [Haliea sp.]